MTEKVIEALRNTIANLEADVARLQSALSAYDAYARRDYWIWQGDETDQPQTLGAQMHVVMNGSQVLGILADRDEGDRRAGAAERKLASAHEAAEARSSWLRNAKAQAGYDDRVSFDVVWAETLAKANQFSRYSSERAAARQDDPTQTGVGEWCCPGPAARQERRFFLRFEDADRRECQYTDETEARRMFARAEASGWNCHLLGHLPRSPEALQPAPERMTRTEWTSAAIRVYLATGDDQATANECARHLWSEQDHLNGEQDDPYAAALADIEGRPSEQRSPVVLGILGPKPANEPGIEDPEADPPAREGSDWTPLIDYDGDGSVAAMARRAATQAQSLPEGCANWPRCGCPHPAHDCSIGPVQRLSNPNKSNDKDDTA